MKKNKCFDFTLVMSASVNPNGMNGISDESMQNREQQYIDTLKMMMEQMDNVNFQLYYQEIIIEYYGMTGEQQQQQQAIIEYYYINEKNNKLRKESFCNSLIAKVQLEELLQEQAIILQENQ